MDRNGLETDRKLVVSRSSQKQFDNFQTNSTLHSLSEGYLMGHVNDEGQG